MKVVKLGRKEFKEKFGDVSAVTERVRGTEPIVYSSGRLSSKERLHEIYHATKSPQLEWIEEGRTEETPDELASEELQAEKFASDSMGRDYSSWAVAGYVAASMVVKGHRPATIMGSIKRTLEKAGLEPLDEDERATIWWYLRDEYSKMRKSGIHEYWK